MRRSGLLLAVVLAVANTAAESAGMRALVYVFKPLATLALVYLVLSVPHRSRYRSLIATGLVASLAGDILLMLPQGLFVPGLLAFLLAHICYIAAFAADGAGLRAPKWPAVPVLVAAFVVLTYLWPLLGPMRIPVACYVAAISTMSWQAMARWWTRRTRGAALAAVGSIFFLASDSSIAIERFGAPFAGATLIIVVTYYAAQWGLALSVNDDASLAA